MQTVIVLGTHNSGSGLVHEYLSQRNDFFSPYGHNEFRICSDPGGLNYLYNSAYNNFGFFNTSFAVSNFLNYIKNLQISKEYKYKNVRINLYKKNLLSEANNFIDNVTEVKYYAIPHYRRINLSKLEKLKIKINKKILNKKLPDTKLNSIIFFKEKKKFLVQANTFINKVIFTNTKKKSNIRNIVLNNAGDILNPLETTKYYSNPKIIVVTRDPRDIFASMKSRESSATPWYNVDIFIKWYKKCFENNIYLKRKYKNILVVKFEKIVNNFYRENDKICKFLSIKKSAKLLKNNKNSFDINLSKKNIGKHKKILKKQEIKKIENSLKKFLHY